MTEGPETGRKRSLADKLNHLFATVVSPRGKPYSSREVAEAIRRDLGVEISLSYIGFLRAGTKTNPTMRHLEALAQFFRVPPAYFFDDQTTDTVDEQLRQLRSLRDLQAALDDDQVRIVALKARGLSPASLDHIAQILDHVRSLEQNKE